MTCLNKNITFIILVSGAGASTRNIEMKSPSTSRETVIQLFSQRGQYYADSNHRLLQMQVTKSINHHYRDEEWLDIGFGQEVTFDLD